MYAQQADDQPATEYASCEVVSTPPSCLIDVVSPFSSLTDLGSFTSSCVTSEWDSNSDQDLNQPYCEYDVKTELHMAWNNKKFLSEPSIKTELELVWFGYPIQHPSTPEVTGKLERLIESPHHSGSQVLVRLFWRVVFDHKALHHVAHLEWL